MLDKVKSVKDPRKHANGYVTHVENHFQKEIDKLKTQKSKDVLITKKTEYIREFKKLTPNLATSYCISDAFS